MDRNQPVTCSCAVTGAKNTVRKKGIEPETSKRIAFTRKPSYFSQTLNINHYLYEIIDEIC
jgi:hypothetical protein